MADDSKDQTVRFYRTEDHTDLEGAVHALPLDVPSYVAEFDSPLDHESGKNITKLANPDLVHAVISTVRVLNTYLEQGDYLDVKFDDSFWTPTEDFPADKRPYYEGLIETVLECFEDASGVLLNVCGLKENGIYRGV